MLRDVAHAPKACPGAWRTARPATKKHIVARAQRRSPWESFGAVSMYSVRSRMSLPPPGRSVSPAAAAAPAHVLLVEDDVEISRMVVDVLHENGFAASAVTSSREMDAVLERQKTDVVVLDIMLPGEDGRSICQRLRAQSGIPIIMLTALKEDV